MDVHPRLLDGEHGVRGRPTVPVGEVASRSGFAPSALRYYEPLLRASRSNQRPDPA